VLGANLADTNPHRFKVHESTPEDWVRALEQDHLDIAIVVPGSSILKERAMRDYLTGTFPRLVATWTTLTLGTSNSAVARSKKSTFSLVSPEAGR